MLFISRQNSVERGWVQIRVGKSPEWLTYYAVFDIDNLEFTPVKDNAGKSNNHFTVSMDTVMSIRIEVRWFRFLYFFVVNCLFLLGWTGIYDDCIDNCRQ